MSSGCSSSSGSTGGAASWRWKRIRAGERRRTFRFSPGLTAATLVSLAVLLALGTWQVRRLHWKEALIATIEDRLAVPPSALPADANLAAADYRRFTVRGHYLNDRAFAFGVRGVDGRPGADLVTPFRLTDGRTILVDRGWLPEELLPPAVPADLQAEGEVELSGTARWRGEPIRSWLTPSDNPGQGRWFTWDVPAIAAATGLPLLPLVLTLDGSGGANGLPRAVPVRPDLPNNHLGYAITWYGLAAGLVLVYLLFSFTRDDEHPVP